LGNRAAHEGTRLHTTDAVAAVRELFHFSYWLVRTYSPKRKLNPANVLFGGRTAVSEHRCDRQPCQNLKAVAARYFEKIEAEENARLERFVTEPERTKT